MTTSATAIQMVLPPPPDPSILQLCDQLNDMVFSLAKQMAQNTHIQAAIRRMDDTEAATGQISDTADKSTAVECMLIYRHLLSEALPAQFLLLSAAFEQAAANAPRVLIHQTTV
jgi:hypothetical protein